MLEISQKHQKILELFLRHKLLSSSEVHGHLFKEGEGISLVTIKRELSRMAISGFLTASGRGRSRAYSVSVLGRVLSNVDANAYNAVEPDKRYGLANFNFDLLLSFPSEVFTSAELATLEHATDEYRRRTSDSPA